MPRARGNTRLQAQRARHRNKLYVEEYKRTHPCVICGEPDPDKLTFHHRNPEEKKYNVSDLKYQKSRVKLLWEISKCDVWCIKCHQEFHHAEDVRRANERANQRRTLQVGEDTPKDGRADGNLILGRVI